MNKWQKRADEYKRYLEEAEKFFNTSDYVKLPDGVRYAILTGIDEFQKLIKDFEKFAMNDLTKAE